MTITLATQDTASGQLATGIDSAGRRVLLVAVHPESASPGGGGGTGTVTSVGLALPNIFSVSGSPVTTSGTLTAALANQAANTALFGPASGAAGVPAFRAMVNADVPTNLDGITLGASTPAPGTFTTLKSTGQIVPANGTAALPAYAFASDLTSGLWLNAAGDLALSISGVATARWLNSNATFTLAPTWAMAWGSSGVSTPDVLLYRDAAGVLGLRNGATPQGFRIYNTFTNTSNYSLGQFVFSGTRFVVGSANSGTGAVTSLVLQAAGTLAYVVDSTQGYCFAPFVDATYDLARTGARFRSLFSSGGITHGTGGVGSVTAAPTITINQRFYDVDATAAAITVTLPLAANCVDGQVIDIGKINANTNAVNITAGTGTTCNGTAAGTNAVIMNSAARQNTQLSYNATNTDWRVR